MSCAQEVHFPNVNGVRTDPGRVLGKRLAQVAGAEALVQALRLWGAGTGSVIVVSLTGSPCALHSHVKAALRDRQKPSGSSCCAACGRPHVRACVRVVLRARSVCTRKLSSSFTDVCTCPVGIGRARSFTKSEYAQPPDLVSRSLFDTYIASRLQPQGAEPGRPQSPSV